jgi:hypothetical protein
MGFSVYGLFGIGAFGYTGFSVVTPKYNKEGRINNIKKIIIAAGILSEHTCFTLHENELFT